MINTRSEKISASSLSQMHSGQKARIESLDFLRGIAACSVMLFHYTATTTIDLSAENPLRVIGSYGHLGVEIFFILSGLVIPYSMHASSYQPKVIGRFLLKRTIRIEIPYLIIIVLEVVMIYVSSLTPWRSTISERLDFYNIILHVAYLNGILGKPWLIPVFWTLAIEFQFYLLIAVVFPLLLQKKLAYRIPLVLGIIVLSFTLPQPYLFFIYGPFFLIGMLIFQLMTGIVRQREFYVLMAALLILLYLQHGPVSCLVSAGTSAVILFCRCDWKWASFLGLISYSVYLIHAPFGGRILMLTNMLAHSELVKSVIIIVCLVASIFVAWLFFLIVEKPSLNLSKRITYPRQTEPLINVSNNGQ